MAREFPRFLVVGSIGFVIDAGLLHLLVTYTPLNPYAGRVVSYLIAASLTWVMNRNFTFRAQSSAPIDAPRQWARYIGVNGIGGVINWIVYSLGVAYFDVMREFLFLAVAAGSLVALLFNFYSNKYWVFRH